MTIYISRTYLDNMFSTAQLEAVLTYGQTPMSATGSKLNQQLSASCSEIDGYLKAGGYELPLATVPESIMQAASYLVMNNLASSARFDMGDYFKEQVAGQYYFLTKLKNKDLQLPGIDQKTTTGIGGVVSSEQTTATGDATITVSYSGNRGLIFSQNSMKGFYY